MHIYIKKKKVYKKLCGVSRQTTWGRDYITQQQNRAKKKPTEHNREWRHKLNLVSKDSVFVSSLVLRGANFLYTIEKYSSSYMYHRKLVYSFYAIDDNI